MANNTADHDTLYHLLPAIYHERDAALGNPLQALLRIIQGQADLVEADIQQMWNNFFIETCAPWVIPYIGDLVGTSPLFDGSRIRQPDTARDLFADLMGPQLIPEMGLRSRADVAKTIYYRRRKGTLPMLEELARDVTGWAAHAVEFFPLLAWSQYVRNHVRAQSHATPDIRRVEVMDRLNGPFDTTCHNVDVRPISQSTGWYNIKNIGFFLWRLQSYEAENVQARRVGAEGDYRYHCSPLGNPAPLFTRLRREGDEAGLATEFHVPGPIRPAAFYEDLEQYKSQRPPRSGFTEFYGPFDLLEDRSLMIFRDGGPIAPDRIISKDLEFWSRPPAGFRGILSGTLVPFAGLTAVDPEVMVTIGEEGPHLARLASNPADPEEARGLLESAIRAAHPSLAFQGTQVVVFEDQLLVIPGTRDQTVTFDASAGDATTVTELALDTTQPVTGVLSGRLNPFPRLTAGSPEMRLAIGDGELLPVLFGSVPTTLAEAREQLESAIQEADPTTPAFSDARVLEVNDRLLIIAGTLDDAVIFEPVVDEDETTVEELKLLNQVGVDPKRGRLVFPLHEEPQDAADVSYHYGFSADLGGGSYRRRAWQVRPALAERIIQVDQSGTTLGSFTSLNAALDEWQANSSFNTIISILDSRTYDTSRTIELDDAHWLVIEAADGVRPHVRFAAPGNPQDTDVLEIIGDHPTTSITFSGLLIEGGIRVVQSLGVLRILHCTLIPGQTLSEEGLPQPDAPSLVVEGEQDNDLLNTLLRVEIAFSITGPLRIPEHVQGLWMLDSILDGTGTTALSAPELAAETGPPAWLERVTILGSSFVRTLSMASEVIFTEPVVSVRRQEGCVRFSFVPEGSVTPQRYRCQPDLEIATQLEQAEKQAQANGDILTEALDIAIRTAILDWLWPSFTAVHYGLPGYAQLRLGSPVQIQTGAEDGSEMGVFSHLKQPQRESNLRLRLQEYLPFGLEPGLIYVT